VAAHLIWGAPASVLVGDFLFARSFELMVSAGSMAALEILARASRVISEGEVLQLTRAHDIDLTEDVYLEIISAKTAELFAAAAEAGAVAASATPERCKALRKYGQDLGIAFQLVFRCCSPCSAPAWKSATSGSAQWIVASRPTLTSAASSP
jgi:octaprenyl-diphosphate synthase